MNNVSKIYLHGRDGKIHRAWHSIKDCAKTIRQHFGLETWNWECLNLYIGKSFRMGWSWNEKRGCHESNYRPFMLRDEEGNIVEVWELQSAVRKEELDENRYRYYSSGAKGSRSRYYRSPRRMRAFKEACGVFKEEGEPKIRTARNQNVIRPTFDNEPRTLERNWKSQRKTQWK